MLTTAPATPRDGRQSATALAVSRGAQRLLLSLGLACVSELQLASGRRADLVALGGDGEVWIVEIKSSVEDFRTDQKWPDYRMHCDRLFFATAPHVPVAIFPADVGLILADGFGAALVREAPEHRLHPATRRSMLLSFARAAALRLQHARRSGGPLRSADLRSSRMPKLKKAAFWIIAALLIVTPVVLAELYLRSLGLGNPILFYANASYRFAPQPNQQQLRQRGARVTIDSKGLRSTTDWADPADAKLLFIGDSVTWGGTYIDDGELFSDGVCQRLAAATGKRYVCGNAGANQYGNRQYGGAHPLQERR